MQGKTTFAPQKGLPLQADCLATIVGEEIQNKTQQLKLLSTVSIPSACNGLKKRKRKHRNSIASNVKEYIAPKDEDIILGCSG